MLPSLRKGCNGCFTSQVFPATTLLDIRILINGSRVKFLQEFVCPWCIDHTIPGGRLYYYNIAWMILTEPSMLLALHILLYTEDMGMEEFLKLLFGVWIVIVFFSLSKSHWILPAICFVFATIIFFMSYDKYEKNTEVEGLE